MYGDKGMLRGPCMLSIGFLVLFWLASNHNGLIVSIKNLSLFPLLLQRRWQKMMSLMQSRSPRPTRVTSSPRNLPEHVSKHNHFLTASTVYNNIDTVRATTEFQLPFMSVWYEKIVVKEISSYTTTFFGALFHRHHLLCILNNILPAVRYMCNPHSWHTIAHNLHNHWTNICLCSSCMVWYSV